MVKKNYRYLFGPVPSRRLGRSLGVDLLRERRCSFDCIFCEVGGTEIRSLERSAYAPVAEVASELRDWLADGGQADVVTLAGTGEPTLHTGLGDIIDAVHAMCDLPVAVLTNSSLLGDPEVQGALERADIVKASLSAWDDDSLHAMNRPAPGLSFESLYRGLREFSERYRGRLWLEVMIVSGINDRPESVARIAALSEPLHAEKVQINTVVRPPADDTARAVPPGRLMELARIFTPPAEVIAPFRESGIPSEPLAPWMEMLRRRPCTSLDIAKVTGWSETEATRQAEERVCAGDLSRRIQGGTVFYSARGGSSGPEVA